ncbi:hypothetical protein ACFFSH_39570 [Streptomyces filamentosus]|uniref:Uncharacterized protein n=1 Tax=Streptomyces filamentosus TaxID=67294 RepID=A0A919BUG2_STRFL|nr:hypothetical protein [Streptomyces filamentosus]GHG15116.1 hypothetical protein GCM10017667_55760 [Streptomyces filamentosus]
MKTVYKATRGDKKELLRDITPGTPLYVINEHRGGGLSYSIWVVTDERMPFTRNPIVKSPTHSGWDSLESLLAREREIYTQEPAGIRLRGPEREDYAEAKRAEAGVLAAGKQMIDHYRAQHAKKLAKADR